MEKEIYRTELGIKLKRLRNERNLTLKQVSEALGIKLNTYGKYERNINPKREMLIKIAEFFGVSLDYLMGREEASKDDYAQDEADRSAERLIVSNKDDYQVVEDDLGSLSETEIMLIKIFRDASDEDKFSIAQYIIDKEKEN